MAPELHSSALPVSLGVEDDQERGYGHVLPLIDGNKSYSQVTEEVFSTTERRPPLKWWLALSASLSLLLLGVWAVTQTVTQGIGTWGLNRTVGWAFDITNFVFWVGIGHAGTLISAILFLSLIHISEPTRPY